MAKAAVSSVAEMLADRHAKSKQKETVFGTFRHCISLDYSSENAPEIFRDYMVPAVEKLWKSLPAEEKEEYVRLNRYRNKVFDDQVRKVDEDIKLKKSENMCQDERLVRQPTENGCLEDKFCFNPVNWYMLSCVSASVKLGNFDWRDDLVSVVETAAESWVSLPDTDKKRHIMRAKQEYSLYSQGSTHRDSSVSSECVQTDVDVVDSILVSYLTRFAAAKRTRQRHSTPA